MAAHFFSIKLASAGYVLFSLKWLLIMINRKLNKKLTADGGGSAAEALTQFLKVGGSNPVDIGQKI
jgi:hypothetical protein